MEYKILRLGHQGDGIAEGPLFAPMTLPGEVITGEPDGDRLSNVRIVTPSDDRVKPVCRHFKACGGCQVMQGSEAFVAGWKTEIVARALAAHGIEAPMREIATSPAQSRRRASFAARRTKGGALAGFHGRASGTIVDIPDCQLITPALKKGLDVARALAEVGGSRKGALSVQATETLEGLDIVVSGGKPMEQSLFSDLAGLAEAHGLARLTWDDEVVVTRAPAAIAIGAARVVPPTGAFLQATEHGQAILTEAMQDAVGDASQIVDLFSGCGTFSLPLAARAEVHAVESDGPMLEALDGGWRMAKGLKKVTTEPRDLFRNPLLPEELARFDAAIIDPPRAGAEAQTEQLAKSGIKTIGFVSCNPVTFARDAKTLMDAGYRLEWVQVVDQFRWSSHVELAARFVLAHM